MGIWLMKGENFEKIFYLALAIFGSMASYLFLQYWMKGEELRFLWKTFSKKG
jgi:hypothetical protein